MMKLSTLAQKPLSFSPAIAFCGSFVSKRFFATTSGSVLKVNDDNFDDLVINGSKQQPIIVDCYAEYEITLR